VDSLITAAARALAHGDALGALKRIALRDDAPALALRGIAMAQLGEFDRAKTLLKKAARSFGSKEVVARARCVVAEALESARKDLETYGDTINALHAGQLAIRRLILIGRIDEAETLLSSFSAARLPAALSAVHELMSFAVAIKRVRIAQARESLERARLAAIDSRVPGLLAEVESASRVLLAPAARRMTRDGSTPVRLDEIESLNASNSLIVDACRYEIRERSHRVSLARRPILFMLASELASAWPGDASRTTLLERVFRTKRGDESHRARLRVEIGRLRTAIKKLAGIRATANGFILEPKSQTIAVLARTIDDDHAVVLALLADGESWSSSSVALALSISQRTAQRSLETLFTQRKIQKLGSGRTCRWITPPLPGFATTLLLPTQIAGD
jgi:hypothetical protein